MTPLEPAFAAIALFAAFGLGALARPGLKHLFETGVRRKAIRLHTQNWTHGQIAHELGRDPRDVAKWLAEADQARVG
jgi:hypothetical protein